MAGPSQIGRPAGAHNTNRPWTGLPSEWIENRACTTGDTPVFFGENDPSRLRVKFAEMEAKAICRECPVKDPCLDHALAADEHGIWGGTTRDERHSMKKALGRGKVRAVRPPAP